ESILRQQKKLRERIDETLSEKIVQKCRNMNGEYVWPWGNDSNLLIVFYVQIMPDDFVMQLHRF
ncbi:TPA: hypothetical protein ACIX6P_005380, partial [Escherichia coli]